MLGIAFVVYVLASAYYIHKLRQRLRGYEHVWEQLESIADHNRDGSFTINIQHVEEGVPTITPNSRIVSRPEEMTDDRTPPRAA